jgi:hypothetical protein
MRIYWAGSALVVAVAAVGGLLVDRGGADVPAQTGAPNAIVAPARAGFVVHEWGTFTSFAGADGVPIGFEPDNTDLPSFIYAQPGDKAARLRKAGIVSMETPVIYFYADQPTHARVRVDFPSGWITDWYPYAAKAPSRESPDAPGQSIGWDIKILAGETLRLPQEPNESVYYAARQTDAAPLQVEFDAAGSGRDANLRGGCVAQREKFLFYRGVGTFAPPLVVQAKGGGGVVVKNMGRERVDGLVLLTVAAGRTRFQALGQLDAGRTIAATLPEADAPQSELAGVVAQELTAAGLSAKEAQAMLKTWGSAWFGEDGARLLYLTPRRRVDEVLPLAIEPAPAELVRVLVGRHDFLTPEQEALADRQVERARTAQAELDAAEREIGKIGRFAGAARQRAQQRLDARPAPQ